MTAMTTQNLHDDHDDFGALHRDLLATGAAMDRRGAGYESSVTNLSRVSLASDNVFSDGSAWNWRR